MENNKKKKFRLLDMNRDGKGVEKGEVVSTGIKYYFKQLGRKFSKIISLNLMMIFQVLPVIACVLIYLNSPQMSTANDPAFPLINGLNTLSEASTLKLLTPNIGMSMYQYKMPTYNTPVYVIIAVIAVIYIITYGWQKVGAVYVTRGLVRGDGVFIWSDFFYAVKRNMKQGFFMGLIDVLFLFVLGYDFVYFYNRVPSYFTSVGFYLVLALAIIYLVMRTYIYLMMVTFDMKLRKIIKNAFIFSILGFKRNFMSALMIVLVTILNAALGILLLQYNFVLFLILPLFYYLGFTCFTYTYASYPIIDKYMIAPYRKPDVQDEEQEEQ